MEQKMNFQSMVSQFFQWQTSCVVRCPLPYLILPPLITVFVSAMALSDLRLNISNETLQVFLPDEITSLKDLKELISLFPPSDAQRDSYSLLGTKFAYTILEDTSPLGNILDAKNIPKLAKLHKSVTGLKSSSGHSFPSVCLRTASLDGCTLHPLAYALEDEEPILSSQFMMRYPELVIANVTIDNALVFGGVTVRKSQIDKFGNAPVDKAKSVRMVYVLENSERGEQWLDVFLSSIPKMSIPNSSLFWSSSRSLAMEMERNGQLLLPWMPWMVLILVILCMLICCSTDPIRSQPFIGLLSMLNAVMATVTSSAFLVSIRFPFLPLVAIMPFLVISIGTDNMFLMLKSWRLHEHLRDTEHRFVSSITETSASLLLTSLTDGLSFSIGGLSDFYAVRVFSTYCALAIICMFFYQITFFNAAMLMCCRRETAGRHSIFFTKLETSNEDYSASLNNRPLPTPPGPAFGKLLAGILIKPWMKIMATVLYVAYLVVSIHYTLKLPLGLDLKLLTPDGSYAAAELRAQERLYNNYGPFCFAVIKTEQIDLFEPQERIKLVKLYEKLGSSPLANVHHFWLTDFDREGNRGRRMDERELTRRIMHFLRKPGNEMYSNDIKFSAHGRITAVKMLFRLRHLNPSTDRPRSEFLRGTLKNSSYPGFVYDTSFLLVDQQTTTVQNVLVNVVSATVAMLLICILLVPRLVCSICIALSIISVNIGVVGALSWAGTRLDIISMITIVMSIGFSVDYVAHTTFHFIIQKEDRLKNCLTVTATPIIQSALTTIVGVCLLSPVPSYIIRTFVFTVIYVVVIGVLHGLLFLPVILDTVVPLSEYMEPYHPNGSHDTHEIRKPLPRSPRKAPPTRLDCYATRFSQFDLQLPRDSLTPPTSMAPPLSIAPPTPKALSDRREEPVLQAEYSVPPPIDNIYSNQSIIKPQLDHIYSNQSISKPKIDNTYLTPTTPRTRSRKTD